MPCAYRQIESYVHDYRIGVLIEFGLCSEFTARVPEVREFMKDMSMHVAAFAPDNVESLMTQSYIKDPEKQVIAIFEEIREFVAEEIKILRFVRWEVEEEDNDSTDPPRSPANVIKFGSRK